MGLGPAAAADAPDLAPGGRPAARPESSLVEALLEVQHGQLPEALQQLSALMQRQPDFRLAHLVYGDLLTALTGRLPGFGPPGGDDRVEALRAEARARLQRYLTEVPASYSPSTLLQPGSDAGSALVIDLASYRLYLFRLRPGQAPDKVADFYVSIGMGGPWKEVEGDERTPVGIYSISSYLPAERLPDLYGAGALVLDYPNLWDRHRGRTGSGIWIHGTESGRYSRPPRSSRGCVTLSNEDFSWLRDHVDIGRTPVILSPGVEWVDPPTVEAERRRVLDTLERWRRSWESQDTEGYLGYYSRSFTTPGFSYATWADHKRRVNAAKAFIRVGLSDVEIYRYPDEDDLLAVSFTQDYRSDNFRGRTRKEQFWRREAGAWRIVYEVRR